MNRWNKRGSVILFIGDLILWLFSLWFTLLLRYGEKPSLSIFEDHLIPFSILFVFWIIVFYIAGLYDKQTRVFHRYLTVRLLNAQIVNSALAVIFFYFIPSFGIAPKTILFIYLIISFALISVWRIFGRGSFGESDKEQTLIIGEGEELNELVDEVNNNGRYGLSFSVIVDLQKTPVDIKHLLKQIEEKNITLVVANLENKKFEDSLHNFYNLIFSQVRFVEFNDLYEDVFDRVPVSTLGHDWFLKNISFTSGGVYDIFKRWTDFIIAFLLGIISLIFYPFIILAIKLDDGGSIFIKQKRVGQDNLEVEILKFRSMSFNDNEDKTISKENKITLVGNFLRRSRLDELPQLWNVLKGDLSLIGPRPELPRLASEYEKQIPYYSIRHLIKPGLSGWAQIYHENHPHQGLNIEETKNKLSYDLYYIKNRSFWIDLQVGLKTIKTLLSRAGR